MIIVSHLALDDFFGWSVLPSDTDTSICKSFKTRDVPQMIVDILVGNGQPQDQDKRFLLQHEHNRMGTGT